MTSLVWFEKTFLTRRNNDGTTNDEDMDLRVEKEDQIEDMNPPWTKGEQVDNMKLPRKGRVMMRLTSIMDDNDDGMTFICG